MLAHANFTKYRFQIVDNEWVISRVCPSLLGIHLGAISETVPNCDGYLDGNERKVSGGWKQCGLVSEVLPFAESGLQSRSCSPFLTFPYEFVSRGFLRQVRKVLLYHTREVRNSRAGCDFGWGKTCAYRRNIQACQERWQGVDERHTTGLSMPSLYFHATGTDRRC